MSFHPSSARSEHRRAPHEWRAQAVKHRDSHRKSIHLPRTQRVLRTCKEIAPDVIGGLLLIPLALAITFSLAVGVELFKGAL